MKTDAEGLKTLEFIRRYWWVVAVIASVSMSWARVTTELKRVDDLAKTSKEYGDFMIDQRRLNENLIGNMSDIKADVKTILREMRRRGGDR